MAINENDLVKLSIKLLDLNVGMWVIDPVNEKQIGGMLIIEQQEVTTAEHQKTNDL